MVPLFPGIPGGPELIVLLLIFAMLVIPGLLIVAAAIIGIKVLGGDDGDDGDDAPTASRVDDAEERVGAMEGDDAGRGNGGER